MLFSSAHCPACRQMEQTYRDPGVRDVMAAYEVVRVDVSAERETAKRFNVTSVPTFLVVNGGKVAGRRVGFQGADEFKTWLNEWRDVFGSH